MRIFISYPREFAKSAEKIYWELQSRGFLDVFLDSETIHAGDTWKVVLEKQIREASVLIILYDHGAAEDKNRYFCAELERIKEECKYIEKLIITVLFPPTTRENLPPYLDARQVIASTTKEIDPRSIDKVIGEVQRREAERQGNIQSERRKQTLAFTLLIAAILILTGIVIFRPSGSRSTLPDTSLVHPTTQNLGPANTPDPWADSQKTCEDLKGSYNLLGEYVYIEEPDLKATAVNGRWEATICKRIAEPKGTYTLEGIEETTHLVRIKINDTYKQVNATNQSRSEITINKDGQLTDRKIFFSVDGKPKGDPVIDELDPIGTLSKREANHVTAKLKRYKKLVREKHEAAEKYMHCIPARGKNTDNQEVIASICKHNPSSPNSLYYIRAMVRHHFIRGGS